MAQITIEDSVYQEFVLAYPDEFTQKEIASMQIAQLLGRGFKNKPRLVCTTVSLTNEQKNHIEHVMLKTNCTRKDYLSQLILNCDQSRLLKYFGEPTIKRRLPRYNRGEITVSFTPETIVHEKWKALADGARVSLQMIIEHLISSQMEKDIYDGPSAWQLQG